MFCELRGRRSKRQLHRLRRQQLDNRHIPGAGANNPQPLITAPPFGPASPQAHDRRQHSHATRIPPRPASAVRTGKNISDRRRASNVINVSSSDELLSLLDDFAPGLVRRSRFRHSKIANNSRNSSRVDPAGRLNPVSRSNVDRREMDLRTASSSLMRRSPQ